MAPAGEISLESTVNSCEAIEMTIQIDIHFEDGYLASRASMVLQAAFPIYQAREPLSTHILAAISWTNMSHVYQTSCKHELSNNIDHG